MLSQPFQQTLVETRSPVWQIKLLYDGGCPLCLREVNFLKRQDAGRGLVEFVDIADDHYDPAAHSDISFEAAMGRIHALFPDGRMIKNVEAFRSVYEVLGLGWVYAVTKLPLIGSLANAIYVFWADRRLAFTGRPSLATLVAQRQQRLACSVPNRCQIDRMDDRLPRDREST